MFPMREEKKEPRSLCCPHGLTCHHHGRGFLLHCPPSQPLLAPVSLHFKTRAHSDLNNLVSHAGLEAAPCPHMPAASPHGRTAATPWSAHTGHRKALVAGCRVRGSDTRSQGKGEAGPACLPYPQGCFSYCGEVSAQHPTLRGHVHRTHPED